MLDESYVAALITGPPVVIELLAVSENYKEVRSAGEVGVEVHFNTTTDHRRGRMHYTV